jgi:hypothetical protein
MSPCDAGQILRASPKGTMANLNDELAGKAHAEFKSGLATAEEKILYDLNVYFARRAHKEIRDWESAGEKILGEEVLEFLYRLILQEKLSLERAEDLIQKLETEYRKSFAKRDFVKPSSVKPKER